MSDEKEQEIEGLPELQPVGQAEEPEPEEVEKAEPEKESKETEEETPKAKEGVEEDKASKTKEETEAEETPEESEKGEASEAEEAPAEGEASEDEGLHLYAVRTTVGKENTVAEFLANRVKLEKLNIVAVMSPSGLKGYVFIESAKKADVLKAIHSIQHIRGLISGDVSYDEIAHYLEAKTVKKIPEKALVELTSGPFKGEKAKIVRVDQSKDTVTVELIEATVPIPITVKMDAIRVLAEDTSVLQSKDIKEGER